MIEIQVVVGDASNGDDGSYYNQSKSGILWSCYDPSPLQMLSVHHLGIKTIHDMVFVPAIDLVMVDDVLYEVGCWAFREEGVDVIVV